MYAIRSYYVALTLANTDKRVLLIGADIRNPKTDLGPLNQNKKPLSNHIDRGYDKIIFDSSIS